MTARSSQTHEHFKASLLGESITKIWDGTRITDRKGDRIEFPDLIRFKDHWYCAFREAEIHNNHPSGRGRVIRSADGKKWETVKLLAWECGDVREPKFAITAEGLLMINTSVYFVSREPRMDCVPGRLVAGDLVQARFQVACDFGAAEARQFHRAVFGKDQQVGPGRLHPMADLGLIARPVLVPVERPGRGRDRLH